MLNGGGIIGGRSFLLSFEKPSMPHALPGNQERSWGELGAKNTPYRARPESDKPSASKPRSRPRHKSAESPASSFALLTILFRSLVACSLAAIFVGFPESFPTLLIASLLI